MHLEERELHFPSKISDFTILGLFVGDILGFIFGLCVGLILGICEGLNIQKLYSYIFKVQNISRKFIKKKI